MVMSMIHSIYIDVKTIYEGCVDSLRHDIAAENKRDVCCLVDVQLCPE